MLSALGSTGRLGLTVAGNSREEARELFAKAQRALNEEARFEDLSQSPAIV